MWTARDKARRTVEYLRIAPQCQARLKHERTLHLEGAPRVWPSSLVAQLYLRVALENGCTKIAVYQGPHARREYDVMDLVTLTRRLSHGRLPVPKMRQVPANLATMGQRAVGNVLETKTDMIAVPSLITPVSSR